MIKPLGLSKETLLNLYLYPISKPLVAGRLADCPLGLQALPL